MLSFRFAGAVGAECSWKNTLWRSPLNALLPRKKKKNNGKKARKSIYMKKLHVKPNMQVPQPICLSKPNVKIDVVLFIYGIAK